jgi:hypothetical protein
LFSEVALDRYEKPVAENGTTLAVLEGAGPRRMVPRFEVVCSALEKMIWSPELIGAGPDRPLMKMCRALVFSNSIRHEAIIG